MRAEQLAHVLAADCLLPIGDRQQLLEQTSARSTGCAMIRALLARETGLLTQLHAVPAPISTFGVEHSTN